MTAWSSELCKSITKAWKTTPRIGTDGNQETATRDQEFKFHLNELTSPSFSDTPMGRAVHMHQCFSNEANLHISF